MPAAIVELLIEKGANFDKVIEYLQPNEEPFDLTGYAVRMAVRLSEGKPLVLELTIPNGRISVDAVLGKITLAVTAAVTALLPTGRYYYNLEIELAGVVTRLMEGPIVFSGEIAT